MSAALMHRLAAAGASLRIAGDGTLRLRPTRPLPSDLIEEARASRDSLMLAVEAQHAQADAAEQDAMRQHYAARAGPDLAPDPMKAGLLKGYRDHLHIMKRD